jgi:PAS domain S-box-containing protein
MKDLILTSKEDVGEISVSKAETIGSGNAFRWETAYRELGHLQSAKKQKAELLRESDDKYLRLVETTTDWVWATDLEGCYTYSNPSIYPLLGYRVGEVTGAGTLPPMYLDDEQHARQMIKHCIEQKVGWKNFNIRRVHKDGSIRSFESTASPIVNTAGQVEGFSGIDRDITERKRMEAARQAAHDELEQRVANRTDELERVNDELRTEIMERKRMEAALQAAHDELEQRMADRTDELERVNDELRTEITERKRMEAALQAAHDELEQRVADRTDEFLRVNDELRTEIAERKRMEAALQAAHDELEKRVSDRTDELARVADEFRTEIAKREKVEEQLQYTLDSFQKTVGMTLQVMGSTVEIKDPYTAGHQTRSATIARNIARMMGLSRDQINIVRMASSIHDIGKLSIPVEILSKPGKLSEIEFPLIREHAKRGYEILKEIEFPWPLAEIIHQHHERMDGSGYPRNLKGDEICVEARIMAVADVVEAMASPRPYRPALGIEAALEEIERNRGTLYDNTVADACLQLFRDNGFQIAEV